MSVKDAINIIPSPSSPSSPSEMENEAAITLQKFIRRHLAQRPFLDALLYPQYQLLCEKVTNGAVMPKAESGKTAVFLPREMPEVVLKLSRRAEAIKRFHQMQEVRSILESQGSSHLTIPKASLCGDFLVEQRLPIKGDFYFNMELYLSQPKLFDDAVREITRLYSKGYLADIVTNQPHPLSRIVGDVVRTDNLPLYIEEKNGIKRGLIGLIDLEHFSIGANPKGLTDLARIFPLHLDIIEDEARHLHMEYYSIALSAAAEKGEKYLKVGFTDHFEWLKHKGITAHVPFKVSPQRVKDLCTIIQQVLIKLNQQNPIVLQDPEQVFTDFASKIGPLIIQNIEEVAATEKPEKDLTISELMTLRSPIFYRSSLYNRTHILIRKNEKLNLDPLSSEAQVFALKLAHEILQELVNGGEIFTFDLGDRNHETSWIRY